MGASETPLALDWDSTAAVIAEFIRKEVEERRRDGVLLGISGGLDSAVAAALACEAVGPRGVHGVILPERDTRPDSVEDARALAQHLHISTSHKDLTPVLRKLGIYDFVPPGAPRILGSMSWLVPLVPRRIQESYVRGLFESLSQGSGGNLFLANLEGTSHPDLMAGIAFIRAKVRMRMVALYLQAERENRLLVGTSNRTEWMVGFFVPQGDGAADIMPILDLYKTQVRGLARHLGVPQRIIDKAPSPDVAPGVTDEFAMGLSYQTLDLILHGLERKWSDSQIRNSSGADAVQVERVRQMVRASESMRHLPPYPRVRPID
jgi:NAD+ synthase